MATKASELLKGFAGALKGLEKMLAFSESFDTGEAANVAAMEINYSPTPHGLALSAGSGSELKSLRVFLEC